MTGPGSTPAVPLAAVPTPKPRPRPKKALWRRGFDKVERAAAPRLEQAVQTERFMDALTLMTRTRRGVGGLVERRTQAVWHLLNLPAGSDVRRLREHLVDLDRQLGAVHGELAALRRAEPRSQGIGTTADAVDGTEDNHGARRPDPVRRRPAGTPRGRAGRAPGS